ncbi:MAG: mechanosensitive ion channel, partial [Proteobacteria bacterium]|nr:mechanosensitive ion channel [Pseudomonadota bacterium]
SDPTVADRAIQILEASLKKIPEVDNEPAPQIGIHDFTYGGVIIGLRFWVPSLQYFQLRYAVNRTLLRDLHEAGVSLVASTTLSVPVQSLSAEEPEPA